MHHEIEVVRCGGSSHSKWSDDVHLVSGSAVAGSQLVEMLGVMTVRTLCDVDLIDQHRFHPAATLRLVPTSGNAWQNEDRLRHTRRLDGSLCILKVEVALRRNKRLQDIVFNTFRL